MSELARKCTDWVITVLEAQVGAAQALTGEAYALAWEQHMGLDAIDHEVLTDRLMAVSLRLSALIKAMLPEGQDDCGAVAAVSSRHRPRIKCDVTHPKLYLATLLRVALRHATKARRLVERAGREPESRLHESIASVCTNLRLARYLIDGSGRSKETLETALHECRDVVRGRRGGGGREATAV